MKKKQFTKDEAGKLFIQTKNSINSFAGAADDVRKNIYYLIKNEAYSYLNYDTENTMFKALFKGCNKHRSTLNDYKICARVEIELNIDQGKMSTDALVALYQGTHKEDWSEIFESACEGLANGKFPTKARILEAKEQLNSAHESDSDLELAEPDEDNQDQFDRSMRIGRKNRTKSTPRKMRKRRNLINAKIFPI